MHLDEDLLRRLTMENDADLADKIRRAAMAAGAGSAQAQRLTADMDKVRRVLGSLTPQDLQGVVQAVGEENLQEILKDLYPRGEQGRG